MGRLLGAIFYEGPSQFDRAPIVAIALFGRSSNRKTGAMVQTYVIRADVAPIDAVQAGTDRAVCGSCPLRALVGAGFKGRKCYVEIGRGPAMVYGAFRRGRYAPALLPMHRQYLAGRSIRRGAYGDPSAVPAAAWARLEQLAGTGGRRTGYTHAWRRFRAQRSHTMASVESVEGRERAKAEGWRTFRVRQADEPLLPGEIVCPASEEGGRRTTCDRCGLCNGAGPRKPTVDIAIIAHGAGARN